MGLDRVHAKTNGEFHSSFSKLNLGFFFSFFFFIFNRCLLEMKCHIIIQLDCERRCEANTELFIFGFLGFFNSLLTRQRNIKSKIPWWIYQH